MGKQLEVTSFGGNESVSLAKSHSHTPRTSDRACVSVSTGILFMDLIINLEKW